MAAAIIGGTLISSPTLADTNTAQIRNGMMGQGFEIGRGMQKKGPVLTGTVLSVSGKIITINGHIGLATTSANTTYTVDATNSKFVKNDANGTISNILVGDTVTVQGKLTGSNIVATVIRDGVTMMGQPINDGKKFNGKNHILSTGNGQPVIGGKINTISGNLITIKNSSNTIYTVDLTNAKIIQDKDIVTISAIKIGDAVIAQGTINGTNVVASTLIGGAKPTNGYHSNATTTPKRVMFGGIGQFFSHLFGF